MSRIGIIGGAFDPIHLGHTRIINEAITKLSLDKMLIIPTKNNPWKDKAIASNQQRMKMIEIATKDIPEAFADAIEINLPHNEKNYTIDTIRLLKERYPEDELYYIMGMDQASQFDKWKKAKKISKLVQLVAFLRPGYTKNDNLEKYHFQLIDVEATNESSTAFRKGDVSVVDQNVLKYICQEGIYLENLVRPYMSKKRFNHTCSVAKLASEFAKSNGLNAKKAYIAGMLHDVAKEMDKDKALKLMKTYYSEYVSKPEPIYHQWLSAYVAKNTFFIDDEEILQAITNHTTASVNMSKLDMCVYCADKLDPLRGYDSSESIQLCHKDIEQGFCQELKNFYQFSKMKNREIDECFFEIYQVFCKGDLNG
ncbi:MAG: nicotinate-nucleotide adenylyltransferase [Succinatimonas sp.]|nr:nicotinate-nucleotide adenylyltransferase [Succinatimonas sp.]